MIPIPRRGFIALVSSVIISTILLGLALTVSTGAVNARIDALHGEYKRVSLALAESCANSALLRVAQNYNYAPAGSGDTVSLGLDGQGRQETCTIKSVTFPNGKAAVQNTAVITTSAGYPSPNGAFSTVTISATVQNPAFAVPSRASIVVQTNVTNGDGGTRQAGDFLMSVAGGNPAPATFSGSSTGIIVYIDPGSYSISGANDSGYIKTTSGGCSGVLAPGATASCVVSYDDIATTGSLTVIANVKNDNGGTLLPSNFPLLIDGVSSASGVPMTGLNLGSHIASAPAAPAGYTASLWGTDCSTLGAIWLNPGDRRTCTIVYDDNPPPAPICADTMLMLDRTGSMSSTDINNEKFAVSSLLGPALYGKLTPPPRVGAGVFGANGSNAPYPAALVTPLSTNYASIITSVNNALGNGGGSGGTNVDSAIQVGHTELKSLVNGMKKVLILISDGETNYGNSAGTTPADSGYEVPTEAANDGSAGWTNPTNAFLSDNASTTDSGYHKEQYYNFGPTGSALSLGGLGIPAGSTITGVEVQADALMSDQAGTPGSVSVLPNAIGTDSASWSVSGAPTKTSAVSDTSNSTYILTSNQAAITFAMQNAGITPGSTVTSVVVNVLAVKAGSGTPSMQVRLQNGATTNDQDPSPSSNVTNTSYGTVYSRTMTTNPLTGQNWNAGAGGANDVNNWVPRFGVEKTNSNGNLHVSQISVTVNFVPPAPNSTTCQLGVELSRGGSTFTPTGAQQKVTLNHSEQTYTFGGPGSLWGGAWTSTDFDYYVGFFGFGAYDSEFRLRIQDLDPGAGCDGNAITKVDQLRLRVYYTEPLNPTQAALAAAAQAKLEGTEIFSVRYSTDNDAAGIALLQQVASPDVVIASIAGAGSSGAKRTSNVVTITTTGTHTVVAGQTVKISGVADSSFDGTFLVASVPTPGTFTYAQSGSNKTSGGGSVSYPHYFTSPTNASQMAGVFNTIGVIVCPAVGLPPAAPPPTTGTLIVLTQVINDNGGTSSAADFPVSVTGVNASPATFSGAGAPGVSVTLSPGWYSVDQDVSGYLYSKSVGAGCAATIAAGDVLTCTVTIDDLPPPPASAATPPPPPSNIIIGSWQEQP